MAKNNSVLSIMKFNCNMLYKTGLFKDTHLYQNLFFTDTNPIIYDVNQNEKMIFCTRFRKAAHVTA